MNSDLVNEPNQSSHEIYEQHCEESIHSSILNIRKSQSYQSIE